MSSEISIIEWRSGKLDSEIRARVWKRAGRVSAWWLRLELERTDVEYGAPCPRADHKEAAAGDCIASTRDSLS